jgi:lytic murein transglycosylase
MTAGAAMPLRAAGLAVVAVVFFATVSADAQAPSRQQVETQFRGWLQEKVWPEAAARGVQRQTFESAFSGVRLDWSLPDLSPPGAPRRPDVQWQAEFASPARYFAESKIGPLESIGRDMMGRWAKTLSAVERRYGVAKEIVVAIWGAESAYGRAALPKPALSTLATLAFMGGRPEIFYPELLAALRILQGDHIALSEMKGSLAGALGQPQFLPSKYLSFAVDFDGDGRRDIWRSAPDTLGSIANYLKAHGWNPSAHWGVEAAAPASVSCALEGPEQGRPLAFWRKAGVTRQGGSALPGGEGDTRFLMMPAGRLGPAFIVSQNFYVLKSYNESDLYALFVGHLADRLGAASRIAGRWGAVAGFTRGEVRDMQERLVAKGYDVGGADGLVGFKTRTAIGLWQAQNGLTPTCFPDRELIGSLR